MTTSMRNCLAKAALAALGEDAGEALSYLPDKGIDPERIKAIMVSEVVADAPERDFYGDAATSPYLASAAMLFRKAGADVTTMEDITRLGIYVTSAVKLPKAESAVENEAIERSLPLLREELGLFPRLRAVMLMGDVAKKAFNRIMKEQTGKNAVPSVSTYKLRHSEIFVQGMRIFPAYIMTGKNLLIEKSKVEMSAEEIAKMLAFIKQSSTGA